MKCSTATPALLTQFTAYSDASNNAPVRVVGKDDDLDGVIDRIITAQGSNGEANQVRSFDLIFGADDELMAELDLMATLDLDELNDPFLFGAYFLALLG